MSLPNPSPGDSIAANDIDEIRVHLTGQTGKTEAWHLRQSAGNTLVTLSSADGSTKFRINDSAGTEVFSVDSDGDVTQAGTFSPTTLVLPASASPSQTTEGQTVWDSDDDRITVGTGSATRVFYPNGRVNGDADYDATESNATDSFATVITLTLTTIGGDICFKFDGNYSVSNNGQTASLQVILDDTTVSGLRTYGAGTSGGYGVSGRYTSVAAGAHTLKLQFKNGSVSGSTTISENTAIAFEAI